MALKTWPKPFQYFNDVKVFLISVSIVVTLFVAAVFLFRYLSINKLLLQSMRQQAATYADLIVLTRHWNARYGGVYVEKKPGVESNRYLRELGIEPDVIASDGRTFTMRNPSIMTKEMSRLTGEKERAQFHMISLRYLNPENAPDPSERQALDQFGQGATEALWIDRTQRPPLLRYAIPLRTEESCLGCHRRQGYKLGDIRGGISVSIPADTLDQQIKTNRMEIIIVALITIGLLLSILYFMTWGLVVKLDEAQARLTQMAITDELTGLRNRRFIIEQLEEEYQRAVRSREPLSLILLDIDHFKRINDTYGHAFGDVVLRTVAEEMKNSLRRYDLLGRIGGEEFLIASPGSARDDAAGLADRILDKIRREKIGNGPQTASVTLSAGVTMLNRNDDGAESLFSRADAALYKAKQEGRDRVVTS